MRPSLLQIDLGGGNVADIIKIVAGIVGGGLGLKVVEGIFTRANKQDDIATTLRSEMNKRLQEQTAEIEELKKRADREFRARVLLGAAYEGVISKHESLINWIASEPSIPTPPPWLTKPLPTLSELEKLRNDAGTASRPSPKRSADS